MKIHHLNCGTMCPAARRFVDGEGSLLESTKMVCHCLLVETHDGLLLVETGLGHDDVTQGSRRLGRLFTWVTRARLDPEETAVAQVKRLGYRVEDVRHIVLTHGHCDHAGGIADFPKARIHLYAPELQSMTEPYSRKNPAIYHRVQWAHGPDFVGHALQGDDFRGFSAVRPLPNLDIDVALIPLPGHTRGHAAVLIATGERTLLHAGDLYNHRYQLHDAGNPTPHGMNLFQRIVDWNTKERIANLARLRELHESAADIEVFCAHDAVEFDQVSASVVATL